MMRETKNALEGIYARLYHHYGPQSWWPAESAFEVMVGAILTQNTNWLNVEKAIANLKQEDVLSAAKLHDLSEDQLAVLIKPAGFFNVKAKRLKNYISFYLSEFQGDIQKMVIVDTLELRQKLLNVNGVGPETADSILLYAVGKPIFVIDAYTRRVLSRHGLCHRHVDYQELQDLFMRYLEPDKISFNEYHALIVRVCKDYCKVKAQCEHCPLEGVNYG